MKLSYSLVALVFALSTVSGDKRYDSFRLVKCNFGSENIKEKVPESDQLRYLSSPVPGKATTILVSNEEYQKLNNGTNCDVLNENFQNVLDNEKREIATRRSAMRSNFKKFRNTDIFQSFPRLTEINNFLSNLVANNPNIASLESIGESFEKRDMKIIKIGASGNKPIIWIDAGIHAREWAAPITSLYIANELVSNYNKDPSIKRLVDAFEWQILPSANPDGYEYSHTRDRMWRKTRSTKGSRCVGVDPNRNWGFHWNEVGASSNPCDDTYAGPSAFSEIETRNIRDHILKQKQRMKAYLSIHAYSQLWLTPWGYTSNVPNNYNDLVKKAQIATAALRSKYGTKYTVGSSTNVLYAAAGGSDDWALGVAGVPYSYTLELRPDENSFTGFVLPPNQIKPTGEETWAGVKAFATAIM